MATNDKEELMRMLYEMKIDIGEMKVDLHHHIQGTIQNRESMKVMQQQFQVHRDLMERRFDQVEKHNTERIAIEQGQARVFKWASALLGLVATAYTVAKFTGLGGF